jgi:hypothetical protein
MTRVAYSNSRGKAANQSKVWRIIKRKDVSEKYFAPNILFTITFGDFCGI